MNTEPQIPTISLTLFLIVCACSSADKDSASTSSKPMPSCLIDSAQDWQRLGSPLGQSESNQFAPSLLVVEDAMWLYYSQREGLNDSIKLIRSSDGLSWDAPTSIDELSDVSELLHLSVRLTENGFAAMIGGGRIASAVSSDGFSWSVDGEQIVPTASFDSLGQTYPTQDSNGERVWYSGYSGQTYAIGLATKSSGGWVNHGPVLEFNSDGDDDNTAVAQPAVLKHNGELRMWFGGYDTSVTDPGPWRIMTATSSDGLSWVDRQLALDLDDSGEEAWSVREPSLALWNNQLWMAYIAMGDDGQYRLKLAVCD